LLILLFVFVIQSSFVTNNLSNKFLAVTFGYFVFCCNLAYLCCRYF